MSDTSTASASTAGSSPTRLDDLDATTAIPYILADCSSPACAEAKREDCSQPPPPTGADAGEFTLTQRGWEASMDLPHLTRSGNVNLYMHEV